MEIYESWPFVVWLLLYSLELEERKKLEWGKLSRLDRRVYLWVDWRRLAVLGINEVVDVMEGDSPDPRASSASSSFSSLVERHRKPTSTRCHRHRNPKRISPPPPPSYYSNLTHTSLFPPSAA